MNPEATIEASVTDFWRTLSQWNGRYSALPLTNSQYRDCREDMDGQPTNPGPCFVSDNQTDPGSTGAEGRIRWQTQLQDQMDNHGTGDPNTQQSSPWRQLPASTDRAPKSRHPPGLDTPPKGDDIASAAGADKPAEDVPHGCSVRRLSWGFESYLSGVEMSWLAPASVPESPLNYLQDYPGGMDGPSTRRTSLPTCDANQGLNRPIAPEPLLRRIRFS